MAKGDKEKEKLDALKQAMEKLIKPKEKEEKVGKESGKK